MLGLRSLLKDARDKRASLVAQMHEVDSLLAGAKRGYAAAAAELARRQRESADLEQRAVATPCTCGKHVEEHADILRRLEVVRGQLTHLHEESAQGAALLAWESMRYDKVRRSFTVRWILWISPPGTPQERIAQGAQNWLGFVELLVPPRLRQEEIGDAHEMIHRIISEAARGWRGRVAVKLASTTFWVLVNAARELVAGLGGSKTT